MRTASLLLALLTLAACSQPVPQETAIKRPLISITGMPTVPVAATMVMDHGVIDLRPASNMAQLPVQ